MDDLIRKCKGSIPENAVKILFAQMVNFLEFIQREGIMHRDLKTQNIMLDENYNVKMIDFGEAKKLTKDKSNDDGFNFKDLNNSDRERKDTFVGTVNYQAPEMITGES
jgi:serine/threonine protein kinase